MALFLSPFPFLCVNSYGNFKYKTQQFSTPYTKISRRLSAITIPACSTHAAYEPACGEPSSDISLQWALIWNPN